MSNIEWGVNLGWNPLSSVQEFINVKNFNVQMEKGSSINECIRRILLKMYIRGEISIILWLY